MLLKSATIIRRPLFYSPFSKNHVLHLSARVSTKANATTTVKLRDYQEECIKDCLQALGRGRTRIGVSLPTGSGKTPVFVSLLHQIPHDDARPNATRSLIIVNSIELATQAAKQVKKMFPETSVEIEQGTNTASGNADVTVATYQTLARGNRLYKFIGERMKAIIIDEAHHAAAPSYLSILSHFDSNIGAKEESESDDKPPSVPIIGFSATFGRHDGLALGTVFQEIVYHKDFLQMIKDQWLCTVRFTTVTADIDLSHVTVSKHTGDFTPSSIAHVMNTKAVNELIVQSWMDRAGSRKSTLVFCANLDHVHNLTNEFRMRGIDARYLHAHTPPKERHRLLEEFRSGVYPVLVNCAILTEGADVPNIDCVVLARPTRSRNVFAQMIGRGMRLSPSTGKEDCHILDFVDSHGRVSGTFSVPTLFGLDPSEIQPDSTLEELAGKKEELEAGLGGRNPNEPHGTGVSNMADIEGVTYVDHEDPFSWKHHTDKERYIKALSPLAWVPCHGSYILECLGKGRLRIDPLITSDNDNERKWEVNFTPAWDWQSMKHITGKAIPPGGRSRRLALAASLTDAVASAEEFAKAKLVPGPMAKGLLRSALWRQGRSSPAQRELIAKALGIKLETISEPSDPNKTAMREWSHIRTREDVRKLTKGQATDFIIRLRGGAKGAYEKEMKRRARAEKLDAKEEARKARETVKVGPLRA